jgi:hypothetical protein
MSQLSSTELRTLVAAQIASGLVGQIAPNAPQSAIDEVAQLAVRIEPLAASRLSSYQCEVT